MNEKERTVTFINSLDTEDSELLEQIEQEALEAHIPIVRKETQSFLKVLVQIHKPLSILEVGTGVGFSALLMLENAPAKCKITTIENYEKRALIAEDNFRRTGKEEVITLIKEDAMKVLEELDETFDFVFMDAAKAQYIYYLSNVLRLLKPGGILLSDNVLQDGDIIESRYAIERRNRTIHDRMREYLYLLKHHTELTTSIIPLGDGVAVSYKKFSGDFQMINADKKCSPVPELLIPASNLEVLKTAVIFGANAVYIGGEAFGLRAKAKNFTLEDMKEGIEFAHKHQVKVYVTANIIAHNEDLEGIRQYFEELREIKPDGLIIADPGVFQIAKEVCPDIARHISTQANNTNYETVKFWHNLGATRVVAARELTLEEIKEMRRNIPEGMEIEVFIHGSMCISYSGRCLLSNYMANRDANRGACTHPCRWKYSIVEESRPGEVMPVYENERGSFIFNSKDLCMIEHIPELLEAGIDSFKIEGRMKNALYVATVARTYRRAIDDYLQGIEVYRGNMPWYREQIANCTYRHFTTGFFFGNQDERAQIYNESTYERNYIYLGIVEKVRAEDTKFTKWADDKSEIGTLSSNRHNEGISGKWQVEIEQRNKFSVGEIIEIMKPGGENIETKVLRITNQDGEEQIDAPHPQERLIVTLDKEACQYDILRKKND